MSSPQQIILDHIRNRRSVSAKQLTEPAPSDAQLHDMLEAANSVPDHGSLVPWRYIVIRGTQREKLGRMWAEALKERAPDTPEHALEREFMKPQRAPLLVAVVASPVLDHPKVPVHEQLLTAGTAAGYLLLAADAMGFGSIWLSGPRCEDPHVKARMGLAEQETLLGFINIGTPRSRPEPRQRPDPSTLVTHWRG